MLETSIISQPPVRSFVSVITGKPAGYAQATITSAAGLPSIPASVDRAIVQIETQDQIRWRDDGGTPTASVGMLLFQGNAIELTTAQSINNFKAISVGGAGVTLNVSYYEKS